MCVHTVCHSMHVKVRGQHCEIVSFHLNSGDRAQVARLAGPWVDTGPSIDILIVLRVGWLTSVTARAMYCWGILFSGV